MKPAYSIDELLEIHPGGRTSVFADIKSGRLPARKLGAKTVILHHEYLNYLDALPKVEPSRSEAGE